MKLREFIEHLEDFDPDKDIAFEDSTGLYDFILLSISESTKQVKLTIKTVTKKDKDFFQ